MWDERYSATEYAYGKQPNAFLATHYKTMSQGKVLCIGEGEGRNAVFLARQGYEVTAVDSSWVGLQKAQALANENDVRIHTVHADLSEFDFGQAMWDGIVSIYVPLPSMVRKELYSKLHTALQPHGVFLLEAFTPRQIGNGTGGGTNPDTMQTCDTLRSEIRNLHFSILQELERDVIEGIYHTGHSSVVQAIATNEPPHFLGINTCSSRK